MNARDTTKAGGATPGPWEPLILDRPLQEIPAYVAQCIENSAGAEFYFVGAVGEDGAPVDVCHVGNGPRRDANARLIAAAPLMLEALRLAAKFAATGGATEAECAQINAAIAAATGEQQ